MSEATYSSGEDRGAWEGVADAKLLLRGSASPKATGGWGWPSVSSSLGSPSTEQQNNGIERNINRQMGKAYQISLFLFLPTILSDTLYNLNTLFLL